MDFVTRDAALMLLNRSPEGLDQAMAGQETIEGFEVNQPAALPTRVGTLEVQLIAEYRGAALAGIFEHQAGHLVVFGQYFVLGQRQHGPAAAFAGLDLEFALGTGANDQVLQEPARSDAGLELGIGRWIGMTRTLRGD